MADSCDDKRYCNHIYAETIVLILRLSKGHL